MRLRTNSTDQACEHVAEWGTQKTCTAIASSWGLSEGSSSVHSPGLKPFLGAGQEGEESPREGRVTTLHQSSFGEGQCLMLPEWKWWSGWVNAWRALGTPRVGEPHPACLWLICDSY